MTLLKDLEGSRSQQDVEEHETDNMSSRVLPLHTSSTSSYKRLVPVLGMIGSKCTVHHLCHSNVLYDSCVILLQTKRIRHSISPSSLGAALP